MIKQRSVILIVSDDLGYGDMSCMGCTDFVTPHIDELARQGARFTSFYSNSPVCSPSRAALLTGRYPCNAGVRTILGGHPSVHGLTPHTPTIATVLRNHGYHTGHVGKWHLGMSDISHPNQNGFDYFFGFKAGCIDYYSHIFYWIMSNSNKSPIHDLWENKTEVYDNGHYFTELVTEKAVDFIRDHSSKDRPFLLYVGYNAPHYPMHAPRKYMERFANLPWDRQVMAAMIGALDDGVGEIMSELKRNHIFEDTLICFMSDNGPSREFRNWLDGREDYYYGGTAGIFKGYKFSLFEGGIRVPGIMTCPSLIPPGQVIDEPIAAFDLFPTICSLNGIEYENYQIDGLDMSDVVINHKHALHNSIFWEMGEQMAVRCGNYKLVLNGYLTENEPIADKVALYDIHADPSEKCNLADACPELREILRVKAEEWRAKNVRE